MQKKCNFTFEQQSTDSAEIQHKERTIAVISKGCFSYLIMSDMTKEIIGKDVPMPLYWWQYAEHQHPDRNLGSNIQLKLIEQNDDHAIFTVTGENKSKTASGQYKVTINYSETFSSYVYHINAVLEIPDNTKWHIKANPSHGELEFCNFWPLDCFHSKSGMQKKYQACVVDNGEKIIKIPHHHLPTDDKNNIILNSNNRFMWMHEEHNPIFQLLSKKTVHAGVCAYMWDAHFGYKVCDKTDIDLVGPLTYSAGFQIYSINKATAQPYFKQAQLTNIKQLEQFPIFVNGINDFSKTILDYPDQLSDLWPWEFTSDAEVNTAKGFIDKDQLENPNPSLTIINKQDTYSIWQFTALGPAYGQPSFIDGKRYQLTCDICTENISGHTGIAVRLHKTGIGDVFDIKSYEIYNSNTQLTGTVVRQKISVITPPISPAPDRVHLLLYQQGSGQSWFNDICFQELE